MLRAQGGLRRVGDYVRAQHDMDGRGWHSGVRVLSMTWMGGERRRGSGGRKGMKYKEMKEIGNRRNTERRKRSLAE
jgi:hypothetical protein